MSILSSLNEKFSTNAEHGIRNNLALTGAAALLGLGVGAETNEAAYPFEALAVIAIVGPAASRLATIHANNVTNRSSDTREH